MTAYSGRKNRTFYEASAKENDTPNSAPGPLQAAAAKNHMLRAARTRYTAAAGQNPALHIHREREREKAASQASGGWSRDSARSQPLPTLPKPHGRQCRTPALARRWPVGKLARLPALLPTPSRCFQLLNDIRSG